MSSIQGSTPAKPATNSVQWAVNLARALLFERRYFWHLAVLLALGDTLLGVLIIWKIPYTKIDWDAYMQQVDMFLSGERDYSRIEGETGPLVYPALHLYIFTLFHRTLPTFARIRPAQFIYLLINTLTFLQISTIYYLAGRPSSSFAASPPSRWPSPPQALLVPLCLSKRAHSIALLRLFNDPIAMHLLYGSVVFIMLAPGRKLAWRAGSVAYSLALGVKMNILLFLPGLLVLSWQYRGLLGTVETAIVILAIQIALPAPFFLASPQGAISYFTSAFDLSREFLYEWTVNWRFVEEKTFLSKQWATGLLVGQLCLVSAFAWYRWSPVPGGTFSVLRRGVQNPSSPVVPSSHLSSYHIPLTLFTSNLIGMTFARSLHYQFHAWYFHQIPFLLWAGGAWGNPVIGVASWGLLEFAWATAPSTPSSSGLMLGVHLTMLSGLWIKGARGRDLSAVRVAIAK